MNSLKKQATRQKSFGLDLSPIRGRKLIPPEIVVYLTGTCDRANCSHCIIKDNFSGKHISLKLLEKIFREMNLLKIPFVSFTGGEPSEYEGGLENAIRLAQENNLFVNQIITNASFAASKPQAILYLEKLKNSGFVAIKIKNKWVVPSLTISMDEEHQRFIPPENVKNLIDAAGIVFGEHIYLTINYVLFDESKAEVFKKYPWLKKSNVGFSNICYEGRAKNLKQKKLLEIEPNLHLWDSPCNPYNKKWPCVPAIFPDREINFCCYFGLDGSLSLGNIRNTTIKQALSNINKNPILIALYKYGPSKLYLALKDDILLPEKKTYGKCGLCNLILNALAE